MAEVTLTPERIAELEAAEEMLLTVTDMRLRQADLGLRVPRHRPRRAGDRQHHAGAAQRQSRGRDLPGAAGRRRHAGHRRRPADPGAGRPGAHHRAAGDGRDPVPRRCGRACDQRLPGAGRREPKRDGRPDRSGQRRTAKTARRRRLARGRKRWPVRSAAHKSARSGCTRAPSTRSPTAIST